ncbi:hypothetical protein [Pseudonocardia acidicola]|uniref:Uncharacterized protein n=1 Tax=Pseudonocardia acidicola TaxID=2724939 RepID=A0ABX1S4A7_9PSEU|nr:hypothetical protein [Pseudonocardia acidicola]NMH95925.1 hypothetical protein [Pseudonocardia acidicola]
MVESWSWLPGAVGFVVCTLLFGLAMLIVAVFGTVVVGIMRISGLLSF